VPIIQPTPLPSPFEVGGKAPSPRCNDMCSPFHAVYRKGIRLASEKHFK